MARNSEMGYNVVARSAHETRSHNEKVSEEKIEKKYSLSEDGYFLLLIKLAWFFLRPAAPDTARKALKKWS